MAIDVNIGGNVQSTDLNTRFSPENETLADVTNPNSSLKALAISENTASTTDLADLSLGMLGDDDLFPTVITPIKIVSVQQIKTEPTFEELIERINDPDMQVSAQATNEWLGPDNQQKLFAFVLSNQ